MHKNIFHGIPCYADAILRAVERSVRMVILIRGASHTGKTYLAQQLMEK